VPRQDEEETLTEAQRLSALEETVSTNRLVLLIMAALAVVAISAAVTLTIVNLIQPDVVYVDKKEFAKLEREVGILKDAAISYEKSLIKARELLETSNSSTFKALMLEQEQSHQRYLETLKQGMRDLARMVPGSRTWLDIYNEQLDDVMQESRARANRLSRIQTSQLPQAETYALPDLLEPVKVIKE
jgi:anti-sigma-K factor RskA